MTKYNALGQILRDETIDEAGVRVRRNGARKPLRTLRELAEEFGVSHISLGMRLKADAEAPKPELVSKKITQHNAWYKPDEVRAWWKSRGGK